MADQNSFWELQLICLKSKVFCSEYNENNAMVLNVACTLHLAAAGGGLAMVAHTVVFSIIHAMTRTFVFSCNTIL